MKRIPAGWKRTAAHLVEWRATQRIMGLGIKLVVPRHRVGVSLVAFNEQQEVFLLRHVFHPYAPWGLPGGWMDRGESPAACLIRELREETGLTAHIGPVVQVLREDRPEHLGLAFLGSLKPGEITLSAEIQDAAWFPMDQLPVPMYPFTRLAICQGLEMHLNMPAASAGNWQV